MSIVSVTYKAGADISTFYGLSGAPVFSKYNDLIGVAIVGNKPHIPEELIGFVPVEIVRDLVRKVESREKLLKEQNIITAILKVYKNNKSSFALKTFHSQLSEIKPKSIKDFHQFPEITPKNIQNNNCFKSFLASRNQYF